MPDLLPQDAPATTKEAFARVNAATRPGVDDLRLMVLLEASGLGAYDDLAQGAKPEVAALLKRNGQEELAHAHRVRKALKALTGVEYDIPTLEQNPYYKPSGPVELSPAMLRGIAQAEFGGERLYETWASATDNAEAAALFRLNGGEERQHGARLEQAAALLEAGG